MDNLVGLFLRSGNLHLTTWAGNVHLLNVDRAGARAELNGDGSKVGLNDDHLGSDDILRDGHSDDLLGTRREDGSSDGTDLDGRTWLVVGSHEGLGVTLGRRWPVLLLGSRSHWASNGGTVSIDGRHQTVALDVVGGSGLVGACSSGKEKDG